MGTKQTRAVKALYKYAKDLDALLTENSLLEAENEQLRRNWKTGQEDPHALDAFGKMRELVLGARAQHDTMAVAIREKSKELNRALLEIERLKCEVARLTKLLSKAMTA